MPSYTFNKPYYNVAPEANELTLEEAYNVYFEAAPQGGFAIRRRPGLNLNGSVAAGFAQGVYWADHNNELYFCIDGSVYRKSTLQATPTSIGTLSNATLPTIFASGQKVDTERITYIASGGKLNYIDFDTATVLTPTDVDTPTSTSIAMYNNRFWANTALNDQDFLITDINPTILDPLFWSSSFNPGRASQRPDPLVGIYSAWNEVYLWGSKACEVWQEDGVTPISPLIGSIIEAGLLAKYSVVVANNAIFSLGIVNGKRAVIMLQGRSPQVVSEPIARQLQDIDRVDDAIGSLCFAGGLNLYLLTFPSAGQTWAYDFKSEVWSQWSSWNTALAEHNVFAGKYSTYATEWNAHLMLADDGSLYEVSRDAFTDNGNIIKSSVRTGWLDHGSWDRKRCNQLIIKLRGYNPDAAIVQLRYRDDGFQEWSNTIDLPIQSNSQNDHYAKLNRMGMFRSRQYEFIMTDAADLALIGMEIDVQKQRN